jgi:hypothetical protein
MLIMLLGCVGKSDHEQRKTFSSRDVMAGKQTASVASGAMLSDAFVNYMQSEKSLSSPAPAADELQPSYKVFKTDIPDRYLHYTVRLTYESSDLRSARISLLELISRYGFFESTQAGLGQNSQDDKLTVDALIRAAQLTAMLKDLEAVGKLKEENIQVEDNTEAMFLARQKADRAQVRERRRANALTGSAGVRNWNERETALSESEDQSDEAAHQEWRVKDKVTWANLHITLTTRYRAWRIEIPAYRDALIALIEWVFNLFYYVILLLPLWILLGLIVWKRRNILSWFKRNK